MTIIRILLLLLLPIILFSQNKPIELEQTEAGIYEFGCAPNLKFVDYWGDRIDYVQVALWHTILDLGDNSNLDNMNDDFHDNDGDLFHVELKNITVTGDVITVTLESLDPMGLVVDQINNLTLNRIYTGTNNTISTDDFKSTSMLLVMDKDVLDDNFDTDMANSAPDPSWDNTDDQGDDPTIYGEMQGKLRATHTSSNLTASIDICPPEAIKTVTLNVYLMKGSDNQTFIDPSDVMNQIDLAKKLYEQACINIVIGVFMELTPTSTIDLDDGLEWEDIQATSETNDLINQVKALGDPTIGDRKIDLIYVKKINTSDPFGAYGAAVPDFATVSPWMWDENHTRTCIFGSTSTSGNFPLSNRPFATAHEMGHVLTNHGHYAVDYSMNETNQQAFYNLMRGGGTSTTNSVYSSKRLWPNNLAEEDQIDMIRTATDIPQE